MKLWNQVRTPILLIHLLLAIILILYGLYIGSPLYAPDSTTGLGLLFAQQWVVHMTVAIYLIPGIITLLALIRSSHRWLSIGAFGMTLAFLFSALLRILVIGFVPAIWLFYFGLVGVSAICYLFDLSDNG